MFLYFQFHHNVRSLRSVTTHRNATHISFFRRVLLSSSPGLFPCLCAPPRLSAFRVLCVCFVRDCVSSLCILFGCIQLFRTTFINTYSFCALSIAQIPIVFHFIRSFVAPSLRKQISQRVPNSRSCFECVFRVKYPISQQPPNEKN